MLRTLKRLKYGLLFADGIDVVVVSLVSFIYVFAMVVVYTYLHFDPKCVIPKPEVMRWI